MVLDDSQLVYLELDAKHYMEKPFDREAITALVEEVRQWRSLGSLEEVQERLEDVEWLRETNQELSTDLAAAEQLIEDLQRNKPEAA